MLNRFDKINDKDFINAFNKAIQKSDIVRFFNLPDNGTTMRFVNKRIKELKLDMNIIKENYFNKYHIEKVCPVCGKIFYASTSKKASKQLCCSHACSNTYFRSGENNGRYKGKKDFLDNLPPGDKEKYLLTRDKYKFYARNSIKKHKELNLKMKEHVKIGFTYHPHKCCVCGEENIVAVHHYDENHYNNSPDNLVPLCPTHHCYWHSKFRYLIEDKVNEYVKKFKETFK